MATNTVFAERVNSPAPLVKKSAVVCLQTRHLSPSVTKEALTAVAAGMRLLVRPGDEGTSLFVRLATYNPSGALETITLPALPNAPTPCNNPFDAKCKRDYQSAVAHFNDTLSQTRSTLEKDLSRLLSMRISAGAHAPDSLAGCLFKAQELLSKKTDRYLIVVGSFDSPPPTAGKLILSKDDLDIVWSCTKSYVTCRHERSVWGKYFDTAGVTDQQWWDPSQQIVLLAKS